MKPKILIVDDNETSRLILETRMTNDGYEVMLAENGVEALSIVHENHPDLIMLDVMMPDMDGYEVCRRLKSRDETRYIPVIMLTAMGEVEDKLVGLEAGAEDYIVKPYSSVEVSARVSSLLRMRFLQAKLSESEKLAALGEMVDGIAHEIRNPLTTIGGMARHLYDLETDDKLKRYADIIMKSVKRLEGMLKRIDEYKWILVSNLKSGNINDVIERSVVEARDHIGNKAITIKTGMMENPPDLMIDETNLKIAFLNIIQNSIDAIEEKGDITIRSTLKDDNSFVVSITDTGSGMDEEAVRYVFIPYHSSKMTGAGLGLTITYRIIQDHGAMIDVESEKGVGTTITLTFHHTPAVTMF